MGEYSSCSRRRAAAYCCNLCFLFRNCCFWEVSQSLSLLSLRNSPHGMITASGGKRPAWIPSYCVPRANWYVKSWIRSPLSGPINVMINIVRPNALLPILPWPTSLDVLLDSRPSSSRFLFFQGWVCEEKINNSNLLKCCFATFPDSFIVWSRCLISLSSPAHLARQAGLFAILWPSSSSIWY